MHGTCFQELFAFVASGIGKLSYDVITCSQCPLYRTDDYKKISVLEQFHEFCTRGVDEEVAKILKDSKSSINTPGQLGNTALHWASSGGHTKVAQMLIDAKASVNAQNKVKDTPLHMAAWRDCVDVIKVLIDAGAEKGLKNQNGKVPLDLGRSQEAREKLLAVAEDEAKSSIKIADDDSDTD